ncbi:hypothetical protein PGT21_007121 [Puccinia graminis f. sp. tritici]|uniref:Uncharacterized protein n=1 Tax=Puccinia graminis f. sp. tritici TaxID=56615 RepID=A0A5B0PVN8_PUCGR|nr:hypothetical protein PGT21_007121 [Puccinia graminis f. sp. tritici]KAA1104932.1 hypothetical protein PGTUg99_013893 [Puccinia graminis f. sp. tritici]
MAGMVLMTRDKHPTASHFASTYVSAQCSSQFPNAWWFCGRVISSQEGSPVKMTDCSLRRTNDCGSDEQNLGPFPTCCKESVKPNIDGSVSCELANKDCH